MKLQAYGLSQASVSGSNLGCLCLGPIVGQQAVRLELDTSSSFLKRYGLLIAVADSGLDDWGTPASLILLEELAQRFYASENREAEWNSLRRSVGAYLDDASQALLSRLADEERVTSSTSLSGVALLEGNVAMVFHIGNCRVLRDSGGYVRMLTTDHTEERTQFRSRVEQANIVQVAEPEVTRYIGILGSGVPDMRMLTWAIGDTFLAGTKGWHGLTSGVARDAIKTAMNAYQEIGEFVERSVREANTADGRSNSTLVAVRVAS